MDIRITCIFHTKFYERYTIQINHYFAKIQMKKTIPIGKYALLGINVKNVLKNNLVLIICFL